MRLLAKTAATAVLLLVALYVTNLWAQTFVLGNYIANASLITIVIGFLVPIVVWGLAIVAGWLLWKKD